MIVVQVHDSIITGSEVMAIIVQRNMIRNLEIEESPVWILSNILGMEKVRDAHNEFNVSNESLLKATKS